MINGRWYAMKSVRLVYANPNRTSFQKPQQKHDFDSENTMLTQTTLKHFKLFKDPFVNDVREAADVYLNDGHSYVLAAMRDAARNQGLMAVTGSTGAGKSVLRKQLNEHLLYDGDVTIVRPRIIDKTCASESGMCDAIIADLSNDTPRRTKEAKIRQVEDLLITTAQRGQRNVMIIEEAHDLSFPVLNCIRRFWDKREAHTKLGIILIGQPLLGAKLNSEQFRPLHRFIRQFTIEDMDSLPFEVKPYLAHKFKRVGTSWEKIMTLDSVDALTQRLSRVSEVNPLAINLLVANAMNLAQARGETLVSADIIKEC